MTDRTYQDLSRLTWSVHDENGWEIITRADGPPRTRARTAAGDANMFIHGPWKHKDVNNLARYMTGGGARRPHTAFAANTTICECALGFNYFFARIAFPLCLQHSIKINVRIYDYV